MQESNILFEKHSYKSKSSMGVAEIRMSRTKTKLNNEQARRVSSE